MQHLTRELFSENQLRIIDLRAQGKTYQQIIQDLNIHTGNNVFPKQIVKCLLRSAMGYHWDFGEHPGNPPYLNQVDMQKLAEIIREAASTSPMDTLEVLDEATRLKGERLAYGIQFLSEIQCTELSQKLADNVVYTPSRSWLNAVLDDLEMYIRSRRLVDTKRLEGCSYQVIDSFYAAFGSKIQTTDPNLIFTADETQLETKSRRKAVVPAGVLTALEGCYRDMPHISGMMCTNVFGVQPPPMIILSDLQSLPNELKRLVDNGTIWVGSTVNGYMTRDLFLYWSILFINWLSKLRILLPSELRGKKALLIMDGHCSRECPLALFLFRKAFIDVVILPSHTTHVLQMFDVGLAGPLKTEFGGFLRKQLKLAMNDETLSTIRAKFRYACVLAFIDAWRVASKPSNCISAARAVGIFPFNPNAVRNSVYVRNLNGEEQARFDARTARNASRFSIACKTITDPDLIVQMSRQIALKTKFAYLCDLERYIHMNYSAIVREIVANPKNNALILCPIPPLFGVNGAPIFF